jgi:hypothetical protein
MRRRSNSLPQRWRTSSVHLDQKVGRMSGRHRKRDESCQFSAQMPRFVSRTSRAPRSTSQHTSNTNPGLTGMSLLLPFRGVDRGLVGRATRLGDKPGSTLASLQPVFPQRPCANSTSTRDMAAFVNRRQRFCSRKPPCRGFRKCRNCAEMLAAG